MIFLIYLQCLFISLFLFFVKVFVLFIFFSLALTIFHSFDMIVLALETGTPCNSFLVFRMSLQKRLYTVFFDGTSDFGVFKGFTLKTLHTLSAFRMKLPLSSFPLFTLRPRQELNVMALCFHNPRFHGLLHRQNLGCWLYAQQLIQAPNNYQTYTRRDSLGQPFDL